MEPDSAVSVLYSCRGVRLWGEKMQEVRLETKCRARDYASRSQTPCRAAVG